MRKQNKQKTNVRTVRSIYERNTSYFVYILVVMRVRMINEEGREKNKRISCVRKKLYVFFFKIFNTRAFLRTTFYRTSILWFKFLCTYTHNFFNYFVRSVPLITSSLIVRIIFLPSRNIFFRSFCLKRNNL